MKQFMKYIIICVCFSGLMGCETYEVVNTDVPDVNFENTFEQKFYNGSDLSYLNQMLDCGATYNDFEGNNYEYYIGIDLIINKSIYNE